MVEHSPDPRLLAARVAIAAKLGVPPDNVTVKIGRDEEKEFISRRAKENQTEQLIVTVYKPGLDLERPRMTDEIRTQLGEMEPIANVAQMTPRAQLAEQMFTELKAAVEGTNFNTKLLEWPGFDPKVDAKQITDFALQNVEDGQYGVTAVLHFAHAKGEEPQAEMEKFKQVTVGRLEAIKEIEIERAIKYARENITKRGLNEQERQEAQKAGQDEATALNAKIEQTINKIRADFAKMVITVNTDHSNLMVTLRSPEQAAAYEKAMSEKRDMLELLPNADELRNTNPLTSRVVGLTTREEPATDTTPASQPQLRKLLARSFLFDKEKNIAPDALMLFGSNDIKVALITEIKKRVLPQHPEKAEQLQKLLDSELFKNHGSWHVKPGNVGAAKCEPTFDRPKAKQGEHANDTLEIAFTLRTDKEPEKNQLLQLVEGLAKGNQPSLAASETPAATPMGEVQATTAAIETPKAESALPANAASSPAVPVAPEAAKADVAAAPAGAEIAKLDKAEVGAVKLTKDLDRPTVAAINKAAAAPSEGAALGA